MQTNITLSQRQRRHMMVSGFVATLLFVLSLLATDQFKTLDHRFMDWQHQTLRACCLQTVDQDVLVVGIDEHSTQALAEPLVLWHYHLADFMQAAYQSGAVAVGLDVVLPEKSMSSYLPGADQVLMKQLIFMRHNLPFVMAAAVDVNGFRNPVFPAFLHAAGPEHTALAVFPRDEDQMIRRFDEYALSQDGTSMPTLAGALARQLGAEVDSGYIDYSMGQSFQYLPFHQLLQDYRQGRHAQLRQQIQGKVVMLGTVEMGVDRRSQPVDLAAWEHDRMTPGVLIHAQALRALLNDGLLQPVPVSLVVMMVLLFSVFWFIPMRPFMALGLAFSMTLLLVFIAFLALRHGWMVPVSAMLTSLILALLGRQGIDLFERLKEKRFLKQVFSGYVSPAVMQQIEAGELRPETLGACADVCVLFADIRSYTTLSEQMSPEDVISFLNRYYERVVQVIHQHGGSVISFMGDGIMAVFGAPNHLSNASQSAVEAALAMQRQVSVLNQQAEQDQMRTFQIGVGLHFGTAVMGHVGALNRHEYTAIGDVTNTASRLEGLTKTLGYPVICSYTVYQSVESQHGFVPLGKQAIKGHSAIEVYGLAEPMEISRDG